jgi:hypothetical protein
MAISEEQFLEIWRLTFLHWVFLLPRDESSPQKTKMLVRSIENSQTIVLTYLAPVHDRHIIVEPSEKLKRVPHRGLLIINIFLRNFFVYCKWRSSPGKFSQIWL